MTEVSYFLTEDFNFRANFGCDFRSSLFMTGKNIKKNNASQKFLDVEFRWTNIVCFTRIMKKVAAI